jgi:hypothetical protein
MSLRRKLVAAVAILLIAGGATGGALASRGDQRARSAPAVNLGAKNLYAAAASYLGISTRTLRGELHPGHPLAAIASATPGRSVAGLRSALFSYVLAQHRKTALPVSRAKRLVEDSTIRKRVDGFVAGTCPLKLGKLFKSLSGGCHGMSMA